MTIFYFGERWDAPLLDVPDDGRPPPVHCPTPVGTPCVMCQAPIIEGDRGLLYAVGVIDGADVAELDTPAHIECEMLHTVGHLWRVCTCWGWDITSIEARLEIVARMNVARAASGTRPLW